MKIFLDANVVIDYLEDSLQIAAAQEWNADLIVTRDKDGFINSPIKVLSPSEFLRLTHENYIG